nr:Chain C, FAT Cognate peptide [synthetic construct]4GKN_F Chain F, FAT Cognate peptide [synthetic construct]
FATGIGIITV